MARPISATPTIHSIPVFSPILPTNHILQIHYYIQLVIPQGFKCFAYVPLVGSFIEQGSQLKQFVAGAFELGCWALRVLCALRILDTWRTNVEAGLLCNRILVGLKG
jgi:hypothetical protein